MSSRRPDPFEDARCRTEEHQQWMKKHRASRWDYNVIGEDKRQAELRRRRSVGLCGACPEAAKTACKEQHQLISDLDLYRDHAPGIWAGEEFSEKERDPKPDVPREDLAA